MTNMGNFVPGNLPNLMRRQRDDGNGVACQRHKLHRASLAAFVNEHYGTNVAPRQAMLRQVGHQHCTVEFFDWVIHSMGMLSLM